MKNLKLNLFFIVIFALLLNFKLFSEISDSVTYENDSVFTIEKIQDELSTDGEWIKVDKAEIDPDGVTDATAEIDDNINTDYVWRPHNVPEGWSPYTNGYWQYTNCGWMWVSYYNWGWRCYHYGRWWWSPVWGWVWSPGFVWAPAWVVWMFYDDYCGWYPISPRVRHHRHFGWRCYNMRFHVRHWNFCHTHHFTGVITPTVIIDPAGNKEIINKTKFISDVAITKDKVINKGPDVTNIEKYTGEKITTEDVTKYNNTKKYIEQVTPEKNVIKQEEGKENNNKNINKDGNKQKNNNERINNEKKSNDNDKQDNNDKDINIERKSNDSEKKEYRKEKKENYNPPENKNKDDGSNRNKGNSHNGNKKDSPPVKKDSDNGKNKDGNKDNKRQ
jgi:hypothetical protein